MLTENLQYHIGQRWLHWLMAIAIPSLFGLGWWMVNLDYYHPQYHHAPQWHKSLGILLTVVLLMRAAALFAFKKPEPFQGWQGLLASLIHKLMYLLMVVIFSSGYLISTAEGDSIQVFGWFAVPALPWQFDLQADLAGVVHQVAAWALMACILLHVAAVVKHQYLGKKSVLQRMSLRSYRKSENVE